MADSRLEKRAHRGERDPFLPELNKRCLGTASPNTTFGLRGDGTASKKVVTGRFDAFGETAADVETTWRSREDSNL